MSHFASTWWQSTGFLYGNDAVISPDDPRRISTYITEAYTPKWAPLATGSLFPGVEAQRQGGDASYALPLYSAYLAELSVPNETCLQDCTLGGCADPTSEAHERCVSAGCCPVLTPHIVEEPYYSSQTAYQSTDCTRGPEAWCASELDYFNCAPYSTLTPATDPTCKPQAGVSRGRKPVMF
jgi:hypothetical protein